MINIKAIVIGLAIMILTSFVAIYGMQTFYQEAPTYDDFCKNINYPGYEINTSSQCESLGGKWNSAYGDGRTGEAVPVPKGVPNGYCDLTYYCNKEYQDASKTFSKTIFMISIPVGVALIAIGGALFALESVGVGIMLGGVITLIYGASTYWPNAGTTGKFLISLVGLIFLIALAYWLNSGKYKKLLARLFNKKTK